MLHNNLKVNESPVIVFRQIKSAIDTILYEVDELCKYISTDLKRDTQSTIQIYSNRKKRKLVRQMLDLFQSQNNVSGDLINKIIETVNLIKGVSGTELIAQTLITQCTEKIDLFKSSTEKIQQYLKRYSVKKTFPFTYPECDDILLTIAQYYDTIGTITIYFAKYIDNFQS